MTLRVALAAGWPEREWRTADGPSAWLACHQTTVAAWGLVLKASAVALREMKEIPAGGSLARIPRP